MKTGHKFLVLLILPCVVYSYRNLRCPSQSEWIFRSSWVCNSKDTQRYICLYNAIKLIYEESCKFEPLISGNGSQYVIRVFPDPEDCRNHQRYQPFPLGSNASSDCVFQKSICSDEGQILFNPGSSEEDLTCRCNFEKGYGFVHSLPQKCDCLPSKEDCSCYLKKNECSSRHNLISDFTCLHENNKTYINICPEMGPVSSTKDTPHVQQLSEKDLNNIVSSSRHNDIKVIITVLAVVCIVYAFYALYCIIINKLPECCYVVFRPNKPKAAAKYKDGTITLVWTSPMDTCIRIDAFLICWEINELEYYQKRVKTNILKHKINNVKEGDVCRFDIFSCSKLVKSDPQQLVFIARHDAYMADAHFVGNDPTNNGLVADRAGEVFDQTCVKELEGKPKKMATSIRNGSVIVEITFISGGFNNEKVLHDTLKNAFETEMNGPYTVQLKTFRLKRLNNPSPPQQVEASSIDNDVFVSWKEPFSTFFKTKNYLVEYTRDKWSTKEEITVPADMDSCCISKVLPSAKIQVKVYNCICHSIRSSPSLEVSTFVEDPTPPENLKIKGIEDKIEITWTKPLHPVLEFVKQYKIVIAEADKKTDVIVEKDRSSFLKQYCKPYTKYEFTIVTCTVNGLESQQSPVVMIQTDSFSRTEDENFKRLSEFISDVANRIIRERFDEEYPKSDLPNLLQQNEQTLASYFSEDQMKQIEKAKTESCEVVEFDFHLLVALYVCLKGWPATKRRQNIFPSHDDSSEKSDFDRIVICSTKLQNMKENKISSTEFDNLWNTVFPAIKRLGGDKYTSWFENMKTNQALKQANEETRTFEEILRSKTAEILREKREKEEKHQQEIQLKEFQKKQGEKLRSEKQSHTNPLADVDKITKKVASPNVCAVDSHRLQIERWRNDNKRFHEIKVVKDIVAGLTNDFKCITITGIPGIGKTATLHHIALYLSDVKQYTIVPCFNPKDIRQYYKRDSFQVFVLDDIFGRFSLNVSKVDMLLDCEECIKDIRKEGKSKVMSTCRLQILQELELKQLDFVIGNVFDMSNQYPITVEEKLQIANEYLGDDVIGRIEENIGTYSCFPLKCKLFEERQQDNPKTFFQNHFDVYTEELNKLEKLADKSKYCAIFLSVVFDGCIESKVFIEEASDDLLVHTNTRVKRILAKFRVDDVSKIEMKLESLLNVYLKKVDSKFVVIHDTMLDFLCSYFGQKNQKELIQFADIKVLQERTIFKSLRQLNLIETDDFTVVIAEENMVLYFNRLINEIKNGKIEAVFYNRQMQYKEFRKLMIQAMNKRDESFLRQLIVTKSHDMKRKKHGIKMNTPLSLASYLGYADLVMFMLKFIDRQDKELFNAIQTTCFAGHASLLKLFIENRGKMKFIGKESDYFKLLEIACKKGHTNIVQMLLHLQQGFNVNATYSDGKTLLIIACDNEHTAIINELISYGAEINKLDKDGVSALMIACNNESLLIVEKLLKSGANVNLCDKSDTTPLMASCQKGNVNLVDLLLKAGADVNKKGRNAPSIFGGFMNIFVNSLTGFENVKISDKDGWTSLHIATMHGNERIIEALINYGAKVDLVNEFGLSPVMIASMKENIDIATFLINKNADINIQDKFGRTCLMTACETQNLDLAKLFLSKKALIEMRDILARTALHIACSHENVSLVQELVKAGACINTQDVAGHTCISISACTGNDEILQILIEGGGNIHKADQKGWTPLKKACQDGNDSVVTLLLKHGALVDQADNEGWTPLMSACKMGHVSIAENLIRNSAKVDHNSTDHYTPLMIASKNNQVEIMNMLIASGACIDNQGEKGVTALGHASLAGNTDAIKCLLSKGADVNKKDLKGFSPLKIASSSGHVNSVKILIKGGANVDIMDNLGWTPLKSASGHGHLEVATILIDNKANINMHDEEGWTPLKIASLRGHTLIVNLLLNKDADITQADNAGWTPLMSACQGGHREIVMKLIEKGANINHSSSDGHTPVIVACKNANTDILQILISNGANIQTADNKGLTPLRIACDQIQSNKVKLLIESGADVDRVDVNNVSPLNAACKHGEYSIVKYLVDAKANINLADKQGCTPLLRACEFGQLKTVQFLVKMGSSVQHANDIGWTPLLVAVREKHDGIKNFLESQGAIFGKEDLLVACEKGHIHIVKLLIEKYFDINATGSSGLCPLMSALNNQHFDVADYLLQLKTDVKPMDKSWSLLIEKLYVDGSTLLTKACATGYKQIVQLILQHTKDIRRSDQNGWAPLTIACYSGHQAIMELLIERGLQPNEADGNKQTPFLVALDRNHVHIIEYLISIGLDVKILNGVDDIGCTPLMNTCRRNQLAMLDILISGGADVNKVGVGNTSALEIACEEEHWQCVDLLLKKGTNFNGYERILNDLKDKLEILQITCKNGLKDLLLVLLKEIDKDIILKNGDSLLTHACTHGQLVIVQLLCREGANIDKQDDHLKTPLELACNGEYIDVLKYLIRRGARVDLPSNKGRTPLMTACFTGKLLIVKALIGKGVNEYKFEIIDSSISSACSGRQYEVIDFFIDSGIDVKLFEHYFRDLMKQHFEEGLDLLAISCKKGLVSLTNFLISNTQYANKIKSESLKYIMCSCGCGHESIVSLFISRGVDFNQVDDNGLTPLHLACKNGHSNIVESIIRLKVDINKADLKGLTPLHIACIVGKERVISSLIQAKAIINSIDKNGVTPLKLACAFGHKQIVEILVQNEADTNMCDLEKWTPLMTSCQKGHKEISEFLIQNQANVNSRAQDGTTVLMIACKEGNIKIAEILIDHGANFDVPDVKGWTPLKVACKRERESIVALLLKKGASVHKCDNESWTPLMSVCQTGNLHILQLLLDHKIDVNETTKDGYTPLRIACEAGQLNIARTLIENGADIMKSDKNKLTPLHVACALSLNKMINELNEATSTILTGSKPVVKKAMNMNLRVAEMLIECGASTNQATSEGITPLLFACMGGDLEIIGMLIDKGANVNTADIKGMTALSIASKESNVDAVKLLLDNGALPDTEDTDGDSPLHYVCMQQQIPEIQLLTQITTALFHKDNCLDIIKQLLEKGANINHSNKMGFTPMIVACMYGNLKGIKVLIENGADISKRDKIGRTVLFFACVNDNSNLLQYLVEKGTKVNDVDKFGISPLKYLCDKIEELDNTFEHSLSKLLQPSTTANDPLNNEFEKELKNKILLLVENGADVNKADIEGWTPLISACNQKQHNIVKLLLEKNADVDLAEKNGITALIIACIHGSDDIVSALIEKANVNKCCKDGYVPLHHACIRGHESIVKMLLQKNVNVNHDNNVGWTPLMFACKNGYTGIVKLLLKHGSNPTWYSKDRWYPLKLAKKGNSKSIERLLNEYGAYMSEEDD